MKEPRILKPCHALDFGPGFYTTLERLKIKHLYNQLVFATAKSLDFIRFRKSEVVA